MKTFLACLIFAAVGAAIGWNINHQRFGKYEPQFGPMDYGGKVTAANAVASLEKGWQTVFPKVELPDGNTYDFGVMGPEEEGEHIFIVKNVGDADLSLVIGASTCKCTVGELGDESLPPGEETEVKMTWTVKTNESTFGQSAELRTNDPSQVAIRFEIKGKVVRQVQLEPEQVTFGEVAAGEDVNVEVRIYSYLEEEVTPGEVKFLDEEINQLSNIEVEAFTPSDSDGVHTAAKQAFLVKANVKPGLKQGPVNQNISFEILSAQRDDAEASPEEASPEEASPEEDADDRSRRFITIPVTGRVVGALSILPNSKLRGVSGGGYLFDFGRADQDDSLTAKLLVSLKGQQAGSTKLSIGEISPAEFVEATLDDPVGRGKMMLHALNLKFKPGKEKVERMGMDRDDYGYVMIESDNPLVPAMKLRLKFSLPAR